MSLATAKARTLESQLLRSLLVLMVWLSGLLSAVLVGYSLYQIWQEQTPQGNREGLSRIARNVAEVRPMLRSQTLSESKDLLLFVERMEIGTLEEYSPLERLLLPDVLGRLNQLDLAQWVTKGKRLNIEGATLGSVPAHWQQAMQRSDIEIIGEPDNSAVLVGPFKAYGADTLLVKIDSERTLAVVSPAWVFSRVEIWSYGALWALLVWLALLLAFMVLGIPVMYVLAKRQAATIAAPLTQLSLAAERFAQGAENAQVEITGSLETQSLARSFNRMGAHWQQAREKEREALTKLEQAMQAQRQFVSDISHDLRTPLAAVLGYTERALRRLPEDADLRVIARESDALKNLVTNLFEVAQGDLDAQVGQGAVLRPKPVAIHTLLEELVHSFAPQAWARGVLLRVAENASVHHALADPERLGMALRNVIDNAVQHTEAGGLVELDVQPVGAGLAAGSLISITDTGVGITPELLPKIFDRGVRGDAARTRRGGGLGLAIVQQIMAQHGGRVEVSSVLGQGSQFRLIW